MQCALDDERELANLQIHGELFGLMGVFRLTSNEY